MDQIFLNDSHNKAASGSQPTSGAKFGIYNNSIDSRKSRRVGDLIGNKQSLPIYYDEGNRHSIVSEIVQALQPNRVVNNPFQRATEHPEGSDGQTVSFNQRQSIPEEEDSPFQLALGKNHLESDPFTR